MYVWHEKHYVGAAHGIVGIVYMLLQVSPTYNTSQYTCCECVLFVIYGLSIVSIWLQMLRTMELAVVVNVKHSIYLPFYIMPFYSLSSHSS